MKTVARNRSETALTLVEVMVVIFVIAVVAGLVLTALKKTRHHGYSNCVSNIKQIGLAFRMWSNDHGDKFPWQVSMAQTGTLEFAESPEVFRHFLAASNELNTPKILTCSTDTKRVKEVDWAKLSNSNISYFIGHDANEGMPQTILSGDRNVTGGVLASNGIMRFDTNSAAGWDAELHHNAGNIGLGDGSAIQCTANSLSKQVQAALTNSGQPVLRLAIPK